MQRFLLVISIFNFITLKTFAEPVDFDGAVSLADIIHTAKDFAPVVLLENLEARSLRAKGWSGVGRVLPEIGVEGGGRSNRESEKRSDLFYYGYARYELSLSEIAELKAGLARKDLGSVVAQVAKAKALRTLAAEFFKALSLQKQIELKEADFTVANKQTVTAKRRVSEGLATESDILEFQMHQNALENDLRGLKVDLEFELLDLQRISGFPNKIHSLAYKINDPTQEVDLEAATNGALSANLELAKIEADARVARAEKLAAWGEFLPRLSAEALYGKMLETDFIESRKNSWAVVGKVTIPIFNGASSVNKVIEKSAEAQRAELLLSLETARIKDKIGSLISKQKEYSAKLKGEQENLRSTQKYFDLFSSEYRRGVKNSPDLASAADKLFDAKWRVFETWRDLTLTVIDLQWIQGKDWKM